MLCLSFHIVAFSYCSRCLSTVIIPWVADSCMSTSVTLGGLALPRPSIVPPSTSRTPRRANVPSRPGSLWVNKTMVGRTRMRGSPPSYPPNPSCESQEQKRDQHQLSWELRSEDGGRRHFHRGGNWESWLKKSILYWLLEHCPPVKSAAVLLFSWREDRLRTPFWLVKRHPYFLLYLK